MNAESGKKSYGKIDALRKRKAQLEAALTREIGRKHKAEEQLAKREFATVGEVLCKYAEQSSPDFKLMLKQVLASAVTDEPTRRFLGGRGWL